MNKNESVGDAGSTGIVIFVIALLVCVVVALVGIFRSDLLVSTAGVITATVFGALDWFFVGVTTALLALAIWLAVSKYGRLRLGAPDEEPEFSTASWLSMLFAAGMGVGLLFWGVAEPLTHLVEAPGEAPGSPAAARNAMVITIFHWGLHAWAVYCISALVLAYFGLRRHKPYLPGAPLRAALKGKWVEPVAWTADLVAVIAVALGVAGSMGMGIFQLQSGLHVVAGFSNESTVISVIILILLVICYMTSAATSLDKGIKWLSNINMSLATLLLLFIALAGPTSYLLRTFVTTLGDYCANLVSMAFQLYPFQDVGQWLHSWTLTYFIWWIAWAPFVGVFIARISRGRTIREFVAGVLLIPTLVSILWFAVFGGIGLHEELQGAGGMVDLVKQDVSIALFSMFDRLPLSKLLSVTAMLLVFIFLVTSVDSATFVLGMLTTKGSMNPPTPRKIMWGLALGALGAALMLSGNIDAVRAVAVLGAIPFIFIILLQVAALLRSLKNDASSEEL